MLLGFHHLITGCTLCLSLLEGDSWHCCQNGHQYMIFLSAKKIKKYKVDRRSMSKVLDVKEKKMIVKVTKTKFISMFQVFWSVVYLIWVSITAGVNSSQSSGLSSLYTVVHACLVLDSFINQLFSFLLTLATYRCSFEVRVVVGGVQNPHKNDGRKCKKWNNVFIFSYSSSPIPAFSTDWFIPINSKWPTDWQLQLRIGSDNPQFPFKCKLELKWDETTSYLLINSLKLPYKCDLKTFPHIWQLPQDRQDIQDRQDKFWKRPKTLQTSWNLWVLDKTRPVLGFLRILKFAKKTTYF